MPLRTQRLYDRGPVLFDAKTHTYAVHDGGRLVPIRVSATGLVNEHFPGFDGEAVAAKNVGRWKKHAVYGPIIAEHGPDGAVAAICAAWEQNGREASAFGTAVHAWAEFFLIGVDRPPPPDAARETAQVAAFVRGLGLGVAAAELRVFYRAEPSPCDAPAAELASAGTTAPGGVGRPILAGTCDALFVDADGNHTLVDWKCSSKPLKPAQTPPWTKRGLKAGCLHHLYDTKLVRYSLQVGKRCPNAQALSQCPGFVCAT